MTEHSLQAYLRESSRSTPDPVAGPAPLLKSGVRVAKLRFGLLQAYLRESSRSTPNPLPPAGGLSARIDAYLRGRPAQLLGSVDRFAATMIGT